MKLRTKLPSGGMTAYLLALGSPSGDHCPICGKEEFEHSAIDQAACETIIRQRLRKLSAARA